MSKLILQIMETSFKNPEKGIFENNSQMKCLVKDGCVFLSFFKMPKQVWKRKVKKIKFPSHDPMLFVMWLCMGEEYHRKNNKQKSKYLKCLSLSFVIEQQ